MKKRVVAICCAALVLIIAGSFVLSGNNGKDKPEESGTTETSVHTSEQTTEDKDPDIVNGTKNPDKLVKITMPLSHFDAQNQSDISGFFKKSNYKDLKVDEKKKTFTVTIKSINHDFMLSNVGLQVIKNIATLLDDSKNYSYFKQLGNYNSNFSQIELLVDAKEYKAAKNAGELVDFIGSCGIFYQLYTTENEYECTVTVKSVKSGKVLDEKHFSQNNSELVS